MSERKRSPNWLPAEKILLVDLVEEHFSIIENKKTDGVTMKQKNAEWIKISEEYNSQTMNTHRTAENLRAQWDSLKKNAKKEASAARQSLIKTGGGPAKPKSCDPVCNKIIKLISATVVGLYNTFDSDSIVITTNVDEETSKNDETTASAKVPDPPVISINPLPLTETAATLNSQGGDFIVDWGDYTPKMLQSPLSAPLRLGRNETVVRALTDEEDNDEQLSTKTPQSKAKKWTSKRRPALRTPSSHPLTMEDLHKTKIKAIEKQMEFAALEREESRKLSEIDLEIKQEILQQEKLKTKLLLMELRSKKGQGPRSSNNNNN